MTYPLALPLRFAIGLHTGKPAGMGDDMAETMLLTLELLNTRRVPVGNLAVEVDRRSVTEEGWRKIIDYGEKRYLNDGKPVAADDPDGDRGVTFAEARRAALYGDKPIREKAVGLPQSVKSYRQVVIGAAKKRGVKLAKLPTDLDGIEAAALKLGVSKAAARKARKQCELLDTEL